MTGHDTRVFKICRHADWQTATAIGCYTGSPDDARDGFIHLSSADQLDGTRARHFRGIDDLVAVAFDAAALGPALRWEPSRGGALFPHLYAALDPRHALSVTSLAPDDGGAVRPSGTEAGNEG